MFKVCLIDLTLGICISKKLVDSRQSTVEHRAFVIVRFFIARILLMTTE